MNDPAMKIAVSLVGVLLRVPLYAAYGLYIVIAGVVGFVRWAWRVRQVLRTELSCPSCHHANSVAGRFQCGTCRAEYHGWVGMCPICSSEAAWFPCEHCGVAIRLPWFRP